MIGADIYMYIYIHIYTGCPRRNVPDFGRMFLYVKVHRYNPKTPVSKVERLRKYWREKFESITAVTHLLITKFILKPAGILGFCNVNICTLHVINI